VTVEMTAKDQQWLYESGRMVDHFRVMRPLGRGGMGEIYLARDTKLGRKVALKVVQPDALGSRDAVERFLFEARATARFSHPHIVTIHAVGEDSGKPYVALEYLEGQTLRQRLDHEQPGVQEILRVGLAIAEALQEAHRQELLHRDLKPDNVMLCQDGRPRVLDFGLAKSVVSDNASLSETLTSALSHQQGSQIQGAFETQGQGIKGTPGYMAPEQWMERAATGATDVWALGMILYELVCGRRPYEGADYVQQALQVCSPGPVPPVDQDCDVPEGLSKLIGQCLEKDPAGRPSTDTVVERMRSMLRPEHQQPSAEESPFRGLLPFDEQHSHVFFGRESEVAAFLERVRREPVLPVVGPSGAGKSSFVQAGVIPRLREQGGLIVLHCRPGRQPFSTLASHIVAAQRAGGREDQHSPFGVEAGPSARDDPAGTSDKADDAAGGVDRGNSTTSPEQGTAGDHDAAERLSHKLKASPALLNLVLNRLAERRQRSVLLYVDQLEELYTLVDDAEVRRRFMEALCTASDDAELPVRVVFTLREEFLSRLAEGPGVREALGRITVLRSPGPESLKEILRRPVEAARYTYEDPQLVEEMVGEVSGEVGSLPLLQFAGQQLWERRDREGRLLRRAAYEELGGVAGALAHHADAVLSGLTHAELGLARSMLLRLVTPEETRQSETRGALLEGLGKGAGAVLDRLTSSRLIAVRRSEEVDGGGEEELELVHESLIDRWARLRRWIDESREDLVFLAEVGQAAELWSRRGLRQSEVWQGEALRDALRAAGRCSAEVPQRVMRFLAAGKQLERRRRWRRRGLLAFAAVLLAGITAASVMVSFTLSKKERVAQQLREDAEQKKAAVLGQGAREALSRDHLLEARARLRSSLETRDSLLARMVWGRISGNPVYVKWRLDDIITRVSFSPDGSTVAAASDQHIYLLDIHTHNIHRLRGHNERVMSVAFSRDGRYLASGSESGQVFVWALGQGSFRSIKGHRGAVWGLDFSPDNQMLATMSMDGTVAIWDVDKGRRLKILTGRRGPGAVDVRFSPDGRYIAYPGEENTVHIWDISSGRLHRTFAGHKSQCVAVSFCAGGRLLASSSMSLSKTVRLWDLESGRQRELKIPEPDEIYAIDSSPNGRFIAAAGAGRKIYLWEATTGRMVKVLEGHGNLIWGLRFSSDGRKLASAGWDKTVMVWELDVDIRRSPIPGHSFGVSNACFSPDGRLLASVGGDATVRIWDVASGRCKNVLRGHRGWLFGVSFSPTGRSVASGGWDKMIRIWNDTSRPGPGAANGPPSFNDLFAYHVLGGHRSVIRDLVFSPDGKTLISSGWDRVVRVWDVGEGRQKTALKLHKDMVNTIAIGADGNTLVSGGRDKTVRIWDLGSGKQRRVLKPGFPVESVSISPDGRLIASSTSDSKVWIWEVKTGQRRELKHGDGFTESLSFLPDGERLGLAFSDGTARIFKLKEGEAVGEIALLGHRSNVNKISFSKGGKLAVTSSGDGTVRLWDSHTGRPVWRTRAMLHSPPSVLTHQGWSLLGGTGNGEGLPERKWRQALQQRARLVSQSEDGRLLCLNNDSNKLELWDSAADRLLFRKASGRLQAVEAFSGGCLVLGGGRARLLDAKGASRELVENASALALAPGKILVASEKEIITFDRTGKQQSSVESRAGVSAILHTPEGRVLGYQSGAIRAFPVVDKKEFLSISFDKTPASPVTCMAPGPKRILIAGFENGVLGIWNSADGALLDRVRLHGPVTNILIHEKSLHVASELGDVQEIDLSSLHLEYCELMSRVWRSIPVVWQGGHPAHSKPNPGHLCFAQQD